MLQVPSKTSSSAWRSIAKALTYRIVIMCVDVMAIFLLTGRWTIALGFMLASNVYTTALYFAHERVWARIGWGRGGGGPACGSAGGAPTSPVIGRHEQEQRG